MKMLFVSTLAILILSPLATSAYASCRDNTGPKGTFEVCPGRP